MAHPMAQCGGANLFGGAESEPAGRLGSAANRDCHRRAIHVSGNDTLWLIEVLLSNFPSALIAKLLLFRLRKIANDLGGS